MNRLFLAAHGDIDEGSNILGNKSGLSESGRIEAFSTAKSLMERHHVVGSGVLYLVSSAPSALETGYTVRNDLAELTKNRTSSNPLIRSEFIKAAGIYPEPVEDLHQFASNVIEHFEMDPDEYEDVVMVTHAPLIWRAYGERLSQYSMPYHAYEYDSEFWHVDDRDMDVEYLAGNDSPQDYQNNLETWLRIGSRGNTRFMSSLLTS